MTDQALSSAYIAEQQSAVAGTLADLERRAQELSFAAVSGDAEAVAELVTVNAEIERAKADALVLERAKATADRLEAEADHAALVARRAEHRDEAARQAVDFVGLVDQADAAVDAFVSLVKQIGTAEIALRREVVAAGISPDGGIVGRSGVVTMVLERLYTATGPHSYRDNPRVEPRVSGAWAFLNDDQGDTHG